VPLQIQNIKVHKGEEESNSKKKGKEKKESAEVVRGGSLKLKSTSVHILVEQSDERERLLEFNRYLSCSTQPTRRAIQTMHMYMNTEYSVWRMGTLGGFITNSSLMLLYFSIIFCCSYEASPSRTKVWCC
jgi:hypothetical protein